MFQNISRRRFGLTSAALAASAVTTHVVPVGAAQKSRLLVPGMGERVAKTGDDFEDEKFVYNPQHPKSSYEQNKNQNLPGAWCSNNLWMEGAKRGTPDVVKRVETPRDGIPGSKGSLLIRTLNSGVPGRNSYEMHQDDLLHNTEGLLGQQIPLSWSPSVSCRVFIPHESHWEQRNGATFGFRIGLWGYTPRGKYDEFWPGIFFYMAREQTADGKIKPYIQSTVRADDWGRDLNSLRFEPSSWCTLGMSMTPDGRCHFFGKKGVEDLTEQDHLGSYMCYGWRGTVFTTYFFNVMSMDDGRSWSTPWIFDDAFLYAATAPRNMLAQAAAKTTAK